jgi:hypothetical protein
MYADRVSRGRSAPNWNLYEYCMRARGYLSSPESNATLRLMSQSAWLDSELRNSLSQPG